MLVDVILVVVTILALAGYEVAMRRNNRDWKRISGGVVVLAEIYGIVSLHYAVWLIIPFIAGMYALSVRSDKRLARAAPGSVRVVTVGSDKVNGMLRVYDDLGWDFEGQSSSKSFGRQAQVTLTFKKR